MPTKRPSAALRQPQNASQGTLLQQKPLLLLMDGNAMVHRAFHAIKQPRTTRSTGEEVRGVFVFMNTFLRALSEWNPTYCAIAFDTHAPTFRHLELEEYKAQRPETVPELQAQFPRVRQFMEAFGVAIYEMDGYEADDVLGTLCHQAEQQQLDSIILTGDTDTLQLVSPSVQVALSSGIQERKIYDEIAVRERYGGLEPHQQPDIKALEGDPSDNIPGVPGIGRKTAVNLIQQFGSVEGLYDNLDQVTPPRIQGLLGEHRDQAFQGKMLTTIVKEMPINLDMEATRFGSFDREKVLAVLRELEFTSMVSRIPQSTAHPEPVEGHERSESQLSLLPSAGQGADAAVDASPDLLRDYRTVDTPEALEAMAEELRSAGSFAFDTETSSLNAMQCDLVGLSFSAAPGRSFYIPVGHRAPTAHPELVEGHERSQGQIPLGEVLEVLKHLLEDPSLPKVAHNANFDMTVLSNSGIEVRGLDFDTMVAAQLTGQKALGLKQLAFLLLNEEMTEITNLIGTGRNQVSFDQVSIEKAAPYAAADADMTGRLRAILEPVLQEMGGRNVLTEVEMPLVPVLVRMQRNGIIVDEVKLREMAGNLAGQIQTLEEKIHGEAGELFNINSTQQLGTILFEKRLTPARLREMELPQARHTKTGFSTDASVLEDLRGADPVVDLVLEYRQLSKLKSTYLDSLPTLMNPRTRRVHTSYNQVGSATGRFSSSDPNLQNIPIRTELGRQVRRAFLAQPGWSLLAADYSQVELRVLAHLSQDAGLLAAFHRDEDIHAATASQVYGVALDQVTADQRRFAKVMNFGIIYGLSAHGMAQQTDLSREESATFIESYFGKYPGIRDYVETTKQQARQQGYVETLLGRRRYLPEMGHSNYNVRQAAERMAINMPVQGTAADIVKIAMVRIHHRMMEHGIASKMLLQVHDELIFEVPPQEMGPMRAMVLELMPVAMELAVPLKVELKVGPTWGDLE